MTISSKKLLISAVILLGLSSSPTLAATSELKSPIKATLKSSALVSQSEISADCLIKSDCKANLRDELASIQIGYIPDPLGELILEQSELRERLGSVAERVELPKKVVIKRQGAFLKGSEVVRKIVEICNPESNADIEIDSSRVPNNIILPGNLQTWELTPNSENRLGMRLLTLTAQTDGGSFRQLIQVSVVRIIEAAQLTRLARPGELVDNGMISKKRVELKSEQANLPLSYDEAVGKCIGRFKSAGTILRSSDLSNGENNICATKNRKSTTGGDQAPANLRDRKSWVIKPGDQVEYHFANGSLELTFPARAIEGGQPGDQINLINLRNQKKVQGIITDKGQVKYAKN